MYNKKLVKQLIGFQKTSFENSFSMMVTLQQQAENILNFFHYFPLMNDESKKFMKERTDAYKKWIDDLKKAMDDGYAKIEALCDNDTLTMFHEQTKKMYEFYSNHANWMPHNLNKTMKELDTFYKNGCDEFQKYVNDNVESLKSYYANVQKLQTKNDDKD